MESIEQKSQTRLAIVPSPTKLELPALSLVDNTVGSATKNWFKALAFGRLLINVSASRK